MKKKIKIVKTIEDASILRKFSALFLIMSMVPMLVLYYIYCLAYYENNVNPLDPMQLNLVLILVVLGVFIGFFAMRSVLVKIINLAHANRKALESLMTPEKIREISKEGNEIAILAQTFEVITSRLEDNVKELEQAKATLFEIMKKVGEGVSHMDDIHSFLGLILETATDAIRGDIGVLLLSADEGKTLEVESVYGAEYEIEEGNKIENKGNGPFYSAILANKPIVFNDMPSELKTEYGDIFKCPMICAPMIKNDIVHGVIAVSAGNNDDIFGEDEQNLFANIASQTAIAVENSRLNEDMERTYFETISALALAVDAKDKYSRGHLDRVAEYSEKIGKRLGLDDEDIKTLRDAARLHDLGKIGIPDSVLLKEGSLNDAEWLLMRKHPEIGESIIKPVKSLSSLCDIIRHHHEKLDGSGYPDGLNGDEITPLVRIAAVVDIYDSLTTDRSYRKKMSKSEAIKVLRNMEDKVDQDLVSVLAEAL